MRHFSGFCQDGYRVKVYVPHTIFEPLRGVVKAYRGRRKVRETYFRMTELPRWNVPAQCLGINKKDFKSLEQVTERLMRELPSIYPD